MLHSLVSILLEPGCETEILIANDELNDEMGNYWISSRFEFQTPNFPLKNAAEISPINS